jgi:NADH-quinone oxidoreductase subunit C
MDAAALAAALAARFSSDVLGFEAAADPTAKEGPRDPAVRVRAEGVADVLRALRDEPAWRFDFLQNLTAVDWPKAAKLELVYHLFSYPHRHELVVKTDVPRERPRLPSIAALYRNADWLEREQYDLLGVVFEGHPDLRRLLMPDDWVGHPMRKDYREPRAYRGMPTTRPSPLDLLGMHDDAHAPAAPTVLNPPPPKPTEGGA